YGRTRHPRSNPLSLHDALPISFKAKIVANDEREEIGRADARSRRVLNFGHTVGHALEALTGYRRFRHGEAEAPVAGQRFERVPRSEEHTSELQSQSNLVCRLLL